MKRNGNATGATRRRAWLAAPLALVIALPAAAQHGPLYPEGSIFREPSVPPTPQSRAAPQSANRGEENPPGVTGSIVPVPPTGRAFGTTTDCAAANGMAAGRQGGTTTALDCVKPNPPSASGPGG